MTDTALGAAVTRLERAIARLERRSLPSFDSSRPALAALEARHAHLRAQVGEAITRLDRLIGTER